MDVETGEGEDEMSASIPEGRIISLISINQQILLKILATIQDSASTAYLQLAYNIRSGRPGFGGLPDLTIYKLTSEMNELVKFNRSVFVLTDLIESSKCEGLREGEQ